MRAKNATIVFIGLAGLYWSCRAAPGSQERTVDITEGDMQARVHFLAADRLEGRATPSTGLDIAAAYVVSEFQRFGLEAPAGGHEQRYRLAMTEMGDGWSLVLRRGSRRATLRHSSDYWGLPWAAGNVAGRLRFVGSSPPAGLVETDGPTVWVARLALGAQPRYWLRAAADAGAAGLIFTLPSDVETIMREMIGSGDMMYELGDVEASLPAVLISETAFAGAFEQLGLQTQTANASADGSVMSARVEITADLQVRTSAAPNVVGIVRGRDQSLRDQYVLVSAHMDGLGVGRPVDGDSIYNGADDNASGTAAVLEVAEAIAALDVAPRRSVIFLLVSGEERGLLGSSWFVEHPPIPLNRIVANVNVDMIGRNWEDTISIIGKPYSTLGTTIDSVATAHPELGMATVGDRWPSEGFFFRSDHFNFARKGIPAVFLFNGVHEDYHMPSDEADKIKFGKATRIARLIYEVTLALANAEEPPRWDRTARERIVEESR